MRRWDADDVRQQGKLTGPRSLLAGLGAGMMEAVFAVTPSETIKFVSLSSSCFIQLIQNGY